MFSRAPVHACAPATRANPFLLAMCSQALSCVFQEPRTLPEYEHSEQARAPHTNGPRDVPRCGALSFCSKDAALQGGMIVVLRPLFAAALVARRRYFIVAPRPFPAVPLVERRRCLIVVPRPIPAAPRMHLMVVCRPLTAAPLVVRCMYMVEVPGPMSAAVASRCCRRRLQQLICACGS
jgi:hypothetical protein